MVLYFCEVRVGLLVRASIGYFLLNQALSGQIRSKHDFFQVQRVTFQIRQITAIRLMKQRNVFD